MEKIYSKIDPNKLLHVIVRKEDLTPGRIEVIPENKSALLPTKTKCASTFPRCSSVNKRPRSIFVMGCILCPPVRQR